MTQRFLKANGQPAPSVIPIYQSEMRAKLPACLEEVERCQQILSRRKTGQGQATRKHKRKKQGKALADEEEVERAEDDDDASPTLASCHLLICDCTKVCA